MRYKDMDRFYVEYLETRMRYIENRLDRLGVKDDPEVRLELGRIHEVIEEHKVYRYEVVEEGYELDPDYSLSYRDSNGDAPLIYVTRTLFKSDDLDEAREYMEGVGSSGKVYIRTSKGAVVEERPRPKPEPRPDWHPLTEGVHEFPDLNIRVTVKDGRTSFEPLDKEQE